MKVLILLLTTTCLTFTFGQVKGPVCLDIDIQFELFAPQINYYSKTKAISDPDKTLRDSVYMRVNLSRSVRYDNDIKGVAIEIFNTTGKAFEFGNSTFQDFYCQVKSSDGWKTIEWNRTQLGCIPRTTTIPPNSFVTAIMPCYTGTEAVTMRYRFAVEGRVLYSQEFAGSLNPGVLK